MSTNTAPAPADPAAVPATRSRRRLFLIVGLLLVLGLGAGAYVFLSGDDASADATPPVEEPVDGPIVEVGALTTNLAGSTRYARVGIALVLTADADPAAVQARLALVKDAAISEIGAHEADTLQSAGGTEALRQGLTERIIALFPDGEVSRVALTELLVQ